mmetsp:Transcript_57340/g.134427  ORF Transcript_57340/g.134427 Transcript_57340/m.134427 type:complete len:276 (-) Transcript_57340:237-1064(-)
MLYSWGKLLVVEQPGFSRGGIRLWLPRHTRVIEPCSSHGLVPLHAVGRLLQAQRMAWVPQCVMRNDCKLPLQWLDAKAKDARTNSFRSPPREFPAISIIAASCRFVSNSLRSKLTIGASIACLLIALMLRALTAFVLRLHKPLPRAKFLPVVRMADSFDRPLTCPVSYELLLSIGFRWHDSGISFWPLAASWNNIPNVGADIDLTYCLAPASVAVQVNTQALVWIVTRLAGTCLISIICPAHTFVAFAIVLTMTIVIDASSCWTADLECIRVAVA